MRVAFLAMSMLCAAAVSMLVFALRAGHLPFQAPAPPPPAEEKKETASVDIFLDSRSKAVDELISALTAERQSTAKKSAELAAREEELKLQSETVLKLTAELKETQDRLDQKIVQVDESEQTNLRKLADVCSKMDPASAATFLQAMDNERAATILNMVSERPAAAILDSAISSSENGLTRAADWADVMRRMISNKKAKPGT